jgi:hypothetical protein
MVASVRSSLFLILIISSEMSGNCAASFSGTASLRGHISFSGTNHSFQSYSNIYADVVVDFSSPGSSPGTMLTTTIATNSTHGFVNGPWLLQEGSPPQTITNFFVWTNTTPAPTNFWCDGTAYNGFGLTNSWRSTNAAFQFLSYVPPANAQSSNIISWAGMINFRESENDIGYSILGWKGNSQYDLLQWIDTNGPPYFGVETFPAGGSTQHVATAGLTNTWWYVTGMANTNLGTTLWYFYTNNSGTWTFSGSISNGFPAGDIMYGFFDIGRQDTHGVAEPLTVFDYAWLAIDWTYGHFPLGPDPWTNAWSPTISGIVITPSLTSCNISWITDHSASTGIDYGTTTSYGSNTNSSTQVRSHNITITGLTASTTYHCRIGSTNGVGFSTNSSDQTFSTPETACTNETGITASGTTHNANGVYHFGLDPNYYIAQKFIPATNTSVCTILTPLYRNDSNAVNTLTFYIRTNALAADNPGTLVATASPSIFCTNLTTTAPGNTPGGGGAWSTNVFSATTLTSGATYWIVVKSSPDANDHYPIWPSVELAPGAHSIMQSFDDGVTWGDYNSNDTLKYWMLK